MPEIHSSSNICIPTPADTTYIKSSRRPTLSAGLLSRRLPTPFSCLVSRLLHGMWMPNVVTVLPSERIADDDNRNIEVKLSASKGKRLVMISLTEEETIAFNLGYLVAFTKDLRFWTEVELSWSAFGADKNFIQRASGPGTLVFELNGEESFGCDTGLRFAPSRLVAWNPSTQFTFSGIGSIGDIYLNEVMMRVVAGDSKSFVLLDADDESTHESRSNIHRLLKLIKRVYLPI